MVRNIRNWQGYLRWKYFSGRDSPFTFQTRSGLQIKVPPRLMHPFKECFFSEDYWQHISVKKENPVILDIGANTGFFSLSAFHHFPGAKVYSFEPVPVNFKLLKEYKQEFLKFDWEIYNLAISDINGMLKLHVEDLSSLTTSASVDLKNMHHTTVQVSSITLAQFLETHRIKSLDLLKLDCEGAEYSILYTLPEAYFECINNITMETHQGAGSDHNHKGMALFLQSKGYEVKSSSESMIWATSPSQS